MKSGYSILTRKIQGIDVHVWLTMLSIILIGGGLLIFKIISHNRVCKFFTITVLDNSGSTKNSFYNNEIITFTTNTPGNVVWDFGNNNKAEGHRVTHQFLNEGKQVVTATLDGNCTQTKSLMVYKNVVPLPDQSDIDPIWGPLKATVGQWVIYFYNGKSKVTSFEWTVVNSPVYPIQYKNKAIYVFLSPGNQTIELQLNHDANKTFRKNVVISPVPETYKPQVSSHPLSKKLLSTPLPPRQTHVSDSARRQPVTPNAETKQVFSDLSNEGFKRMFEEVVAGRKGAQDFNSYLCSGANTKVVANEKDETVESICSILSKKKYTIESVRTSRDFKGCVSVINISYKKKFLGVL